MDILFSWLTETGISQYLRGARWGYAAVSASHIFGIALLVGTIVPLDLRLLGVWRHMPIDSLARILGPVAAVGLLIAATTGGLLFSVRPVEYAGLGVFQVKMALVLLGTGSALVMHMRYGSKLADAPPAHLACAGVFSLLCWSGALVLGRFIAFFGD